MSRRDVAQSAFALVAHRRHFLSSTARFPMPPKLTAYAHFAEEAEPTLKEAGRTRVPAIELAERWRKLDAEEKKPFEEKAAAAQEAYLQEMTMRYMDGEEDEDGEEDHDDEGNGEDEENEDDDKQASGDVADCRVTTKTPFPVARLKRVAAAGAENVSFIGREATFAISKACEVFIDRLTWGTMRYMRSSGRKVLNAPDLVSALRLHPSPEVMQFFVEELAPAPPAPPPKPANAKGGKGKKENKKKAESKKGEKKEEEPPKKEEKAKGGKRKASEPAADAAAATESAEPPKKRGRPKKNP